MNNSEPSMAANVRRALMATAVEQYIRNEWKLTPILFRSKQPFHNDWNSIERAMTSELVLDSQGMPVLDYNVGLMHAYSGTCAVDIDDLERTREIFAELGVNVDELLNAPDAVQIISGVSNRGKLLYKLNDPLPSQTITEMIEGKRETLFELRCGTSDGKKSVQDVTPPSIHPVTQQEYKWGGNWQAPPPLPEKLLNYWRSLIESKMSNDDGLVTMGEVITGGVDVAEVPAMLKCISPDITYHSWFNVGVALFRAGLPFEMFKEWSDKGLKTTKPGQTAHGLWKALERSKTIVTKPVTLRTVRNLALEDGYVPPKPTAEGLFKPIAGNVKPKSFNILDDDKRYTSVDFINDIPDTNLIKNVARSFSARTMMPIHTVFTIGLGVFSTIACRNYRVAYQHGGGLPLSLLVVAEQKSSATKTWAVTLFQQPFIDEKQELVTAAKINLVQLERDLESLKKKRKKDANTVLDDPNDTELVELESQIARLTGLTKSILFIANSTPEALAKALVHTNGYCSLVSSEQGLLDSFISNIYGKAAHNDGLLQMWNGGYYSILRAKSDTYDGSITGGLVCFAQHGSIEKVVNASGNSGVVQRCLFLVEPTLYHLIDHVNKPPLDNLAIDRYGLRCKELMTTSFNTQVAINNLPMLIISNDAWLKIHLFQNELKPLIQPNGKYSYDTLSGFCGKAENHIMKLAGNLYLTDSEFNKNDLRIPDRFVDIAIKMFKQFAESNYQLLEIKGVSGKKAEYQAIIDWFLKDATAKPRSMREIKNAMRFNKVFKDAEKVNDAIKEAVDAMLDEGYLLTYDKKYLVDHNR